MREAIEIAAATVADAPAIAVIYAHHVTEGTASWELSPPDATEMAARIGKVLEHGWPWLVARGRDGAVLGYAYAQQYHPRPGYRFACEDSIYLRHDVLGRGIGGALLSALVEASAAAGFRQMVALISGSEPASIALHAKFGFVEMGRLKSLGRKHGQWLDVLQMQRGLGEGDATPPAVEPA